MVSVPEGRPKSWSVPNGAKLSRIWDGFCPEGATGFSPGFQPWEPSKQMGSP